MGHSHASIFIGLSMAVAILASWTALGLLERVRESLQVRRLIWLLATGLVMGGGIWSMHFIAMLGFDPGVPVSYDLPLTILSFLLAAVGTSGAFYAAINAALSHKHLLIAGTAMGASITLMHYVGMAAIRSTAVISHNLWYPFIALLVAIIASVVALMLARRHLATQQKIVAAVVLSMAVSAMHYIGMAGVRVESVIAEHVHMTQTKPVFLALGTAAITLLLLGAALAMAHLDRRFRFMSVLDAGDIGYWEVQLPASQLWLSPHGRKILGLPPSGPMDPARTKPLIDVAIAMAKRTMRNAAPIPRSKETEIRIGDRWLSVRGRMVHQRREHHIKMAGVLIDITEAHINRTALEVSDQRQKLLLNELNHRLKNNFASIQSIAALTARGSPDLDTFIETFQSRLMALSNTQTLLTNSSWESAGLVAIFEQELHPYTERAVIEGPPLEMDPKRALSMGLIAHELTTNAAKHGALKTSDGTIHVRWTQPNAEGKVTLEWREAGGPVVKPPKRKGFGSRLIRSSIEGPLGGTANIDYQPSGLRVVLQFTIQDTPQPPAPRLKKKAASATF